MTASVAFHELNWSARSFGPALAQVTLQTSQRYEKKRSACAAISPPIVS